MTDETYDLTLAIFDSGEARDKLRGATKIVLDLETAYGDAIQEAAEAEAFYRLRLAQQFKAHRDNGAPVEAANIMARGEVAPLKQVALETAGKSRLAEKKLDDAVDTRRSLWRLVEWAREKEARTPAQQSMAAGAGWP